MKSVLTIRLALFLLSGYLFLCSGAQKIYAQSIDPTQVLLNLETIKQDLNRIQRETRQLSLLARDEFRRELAILKRELKEAQESLKTELVNFQFVAEETQEETRPIVEKFKKDVERLTLQIRETLEREQEIFVQEQDVSRQAGDRSFTLAAVERKKSKSRIQPSRPNTKDAFSEAKLNLPRIKTVDPNQPLVFDQIETEAPSITTDQFGEYEKSGIEAPTGSFKSFKIPEEKEARLDGRDLQFNDQPIDIPSLYAPKAIPLNPGPAPMTKLEKYRRALSKYSMRIKGVKSRLNETSNPYPLWLNLGKTYLDTEHYLQSLHPTDRMEVMESETTSQFALGGYQSALLAYKNALRLQPEDGDTNVAMGDIYDEIHEGASAINHMYRARYLYQQNNENLKANVASAKLRMLRKKYEKIRVCDGTGPDEEGCWLQVPRTEVGPGEVKNNARFYQKGIPPKSRYNLETKF